MFDSDWVTVVIPTYNRAHVIGETIRSVFAQTYDRWDIVVVDDGSTDNTAEVVAQFPGRITYIRQEHSGLPAVARNVGVRLGRGEYIAFLDSDDLWLPDKLALQVDVLKQYPKAGLLCADAYILNESQEKQTNVTIWDGKVPRSGKVFGELYLWNFVHTSAAVVRRECFDTVDYFNENAIYGAVEDYHLWLRIAAQYELIPLQDALIYYSLHKGRYSVQRKDYVNLSVIAVLLDIRNRYPGMVKQLGKKAGKRIGDLYDNIGYSALKQGKIIDAWRAFEQAAMWMQYTVQVPLLRGLVAFGLMCARILAAKLLP